jgi:hypothetical protein
LKKSGHIYFLLAFLFILFFSKSSFANISHPGFSKKQVFEIKTHVAILSDFEDTDEFQDKTRFNHEGSVPFTLIKKIVLSCSINSPEILPGACILHSSQKRAIIRVFRL